jgi:hypothetical protein
MLLAPITTLGIRRTISGRKRLVVISRMNISISKRYTDDARPRSGDGEVVAAGVLGVTGR